MAKQWFVAVPKDGAFSVAVEGLLEKKYPIYLPFVYDRVAEGRKVRCEQELRYPGYIILAFDLTLDEHGPAKRTPGIDYLLPKGADPVPLPDDWVPTMRVYELRSYLRAKARSKPITRKDIHPHDKVMIDKAEHAAFGKEGEVMETSKYRAKVLVGLNIFNIELIHLRKVELEERAA